MRRCAPRLVAGVPHLFHIALIAPEIPQNAGNIGRLCLNVGARLHLIHPLGFATDEKAVRRAGLDYWKHVDVAEHADTDAFLAWASGRRMYSFSSHGKAPYTTIGFAPDDVLVFGRESVGLAPEWTSKYGSWFIPMVGPTRSLNVANAAAVVAYEALRQLRPALFVARE